MCEDFPCCGHGVGECNEEPEFTKSFWMDEMGDDVWDDDDYDWR